MMTADSSRPNDGAVIFLPWHTPCPCEAAPGWPYFRFTRDGRFLAVLETLIDEPAVDRVLALGGNEAISLRPGWRRLNLSRHAEWLAYQHCDSGAVEIWKHPETERLHKFYLEADVTRAEFRPDGAQLACLLGRDLPGIWCWEGEWRTRRLGEGARVFSFLSYSGDSRFLAAACDQRKIHLWNAQASAIVAVSPPQDAIAGLSLNEDGTLVAAGAGAEVRIWETRGGLFRTLAVEEPVWRVFFSPKGNLLAVVHDKGVQMWDIRTGARLGAFAFPVKPANFQVAFSSDGTRAAWGNSSRACPGPSINTALGFFSLTAGGVTTTLLDARRTAPWAF